MGKLQLINNVMNFIGNTLIKISMLTLFIAMILTTCDVFARFLVEPITGTYELMLILIAITFFTSLTISEINKVHVKIDYLLAKLPVSVQNIFHVMTYLVLTVMFFIAFWNTLLYAQRIAISQQTSGVLDLPIYVFIIFAAICLLFLALSMLLEVINFMAKLRGEK